MVEEESYGFYKVLGIGRDAGVKEIRRAYLDLAKVKHPDKGGDEEEWKRILTAYETLSDDGKKQMYDMTGKLDNSSGGGGGGGGPPGMPFGFGPGGFHVDMSDFLGGMFNNVRQHQQARRQTKRPKGPTKTHEIPLPLADFYKGRKFTIDLARQVFCSECVGNGCIHYKTCAECRGAGVKETMTQLGPGMMVMNRAPCGACGTEGRIRGPACSGCDGKGLINSPKVLEVDIQPGTAVGYTKTFEGMCSDSQEFEKAGDFQMRFVEAAEDLDVERQGNNLLHRCKISLSESLLGCERVIKNHPGFPDLSVNIPPGTINQEIVSVKGKGMPGGGNLLLHVTVVVGEEEKKALENHKEILRSIFNT